MTRAPILVAGIALVAFTGIALGMLRSEPAPAPPVTPEPVITELLAKADRLPLAPNPQVLLAKAFAEQAPIDTASVSQPAIPPAIPAPQIEPEKLTRHLRVIAPPITRTRDVCARHHMHRVSTHGGRSWRCRR